jgi:hypothetical protein
MQLWKKLARNAGRSRDPVLAKSFFRFWNFITKAVAVNGNKRTLASCFNLLDWNQFNARSRVKGPKLD